MILADFRNVASKVSWKFFKNSKYNIWRVFFFFLLSLIFLEEINFLHWESNVLQRW
jgi:hypothetical protein